MTKTRLRWLVPIGLGLVVRLIPAPAGLSAGAWHYFALFVGVIAALIAEPLPGPAIGLIGIAFAAAFILVGQTPNDAMRWALSGFSNDTVWLIFSANMFAMGYRVTGLGRRIALLLVKLLGKRTLGLGYAIAIADLILAPFMPSSTARFGGTIYPVVKNIPPLYGSTPSAHPRKIGSYLVWSAFVSNCVTSAMFLTSSAPNLLAVELARRIAHVEITWIGWFLAFLPVGIFLFLVTPLHLYWLYPPEIKHGDEVVQWAINELSLLGPITRREVTMALLAVVALIGWIAGARWLAPVTVALATISLMILFKVFAWSDIAGDKQAWSMLVWFATLVAMADGLNSVGFLKWFAERTTASVANISPIAIVLTVVTVYFVGHYFFASTTAHTVAVLPVFLAALVVIPGIPMRAVTFLLVFSSGIMGVITPYAIGPAAIAYSSGYISTKAFYRLGAIFGLLFLFSLLALALPYILAFNR